MRFFVRSHRLQPVVTALLACILLSSAASDYEPLSSSYAQPPLHFAQGQAIWPDEWQADSAFLRVWSRADAPVAMGAASRSWLWGPTPFAVANEPYAESPTGRRLVEYLDKGRVEVNDPTADRNSSWFVTSGLLVYEMITGRAQTGNSRFESRTPAPVIVAGDPNSLDAPTYAAFARHQAPVPKSQGIPSQRIGRDGSLTSLPAQGMHVDPKLFGLAHFDEVSGHNVPAVFLGWMRSTGAVLEDGRLVKAPLLDPLYVLGRPVTEPYWADVLVGRVPTRVLIQLFERRALTYNPNNPHEWRVEMANVGRAYYQWRYSSNPPEPAIAAEVLAGSLKVRGWNWPPSEPVRVQIDLAGGTEPLTGPLSTQPNTAGRFALDVPLSPQLQGALQAKANIQVKAQGRQASTALGLAAEIVTGRVQIEGMLTQVGQPARLTLRARNREEWTLTLDANSQILYSEGEAASRSAMSAGVAAQAEGAASGSTMAVTTLRLLSVSRSGAQLGYEWQSGGGGIRVSGTRWPGERQVNLALMHLNTSGPQPIATVRADSRGNLSTIISVPSANALPAGPLWLFATVVEGNQQLAQVAIPFDSQQPSSEPGQGPPSLFISSHAGEQKGGLGSACWRRVCSDTIGVPLPEPPIGVRRGEVLGFRSQYGPDPDVGLTPTTFTADLYTYPVSPAEEGAFVGGIYHFSPKSLRIYSTGTVPGRPFSISLPQTLPAGKYALTVNVSWPDPDGGTGEARYGFNLRVP